VDQLLDRPPILFGFAEAPQRDLEVERLTDGEDAAPLVRKLAREARRRAGADGQLSVPLSRVAVFASRDGQSQPSPGFALLATLSASVVFMVIAARYAIPDAAPGPSLPYRFFEWAVVDHLGPPSDECLATRVLEYARDEQVGRDALKALARRGPSAARGVRARLSDLRSHWPPPDYTVKASGIRELLQKLNVYGDHETVRQWADFDWRHDFPRPKLETELHLPR
jgi:hypothetical protein